VRARGWPAGCCPARLVHRDRPRGTSTSSARANQVNDLVWGRQAAALLLGIDSLAVNENVQRPWRAHADASGNPQFVFDALFQAHGLRLDIGSKETALDFDGHSFAHTTTHVTRKPGSTSSQSRSKMLVIGRAERKTTAN